MTVSESKKINELSNILREIKTENAQFRKDVVAEIETLKTKQKPVQLEIDILRSVQIAVGEAIKTSLTGYDSPLVKLTDIVVNNHSQQIKRVVSDSFNEVINTDEFKQAILNGFTHKVARTIISKGGGAFERVVNDLKQDAVFRSKLAIAVDSVVNEVLNERKCSSK